MKKNKCVSLIILVVVILLLILGILFLKFFDKKEEVFGIVSKTSINGYRIVNDWNSNGELIKISKNGMYGFMDMDGKIVLDVKYPESIYMVDKERFLYSEVSDYEDDNIENDVWYYYLIDSKGNVLLSSDYIRVIHDFFDTNIYYYLTSSTGNLNNIVYDSDLNIIYKSWDELYFDVFDDYLVLEDEFYNYKTKDIYVNDLEIYNLNKYGNYLVNKVNNILEIYDLSLDNWPNYPKKYEKYVDFLNNGYLLIDGEEKIFLDKDGNLKDFDLSELLKDKYDLEFSSCDVGFNILRDDKKIDNKCYTTLDNNLIDNDVLIYFNDNDDTYENNVLIGGKKVFEPIEDYISRYYVDGNYIIREYGTSNEIIGIQVYDSNAKKINACDGYLYFDSNICSDSDGFYLLDDDYNKISDKYDNITCNSSVFCIVTKDGRNGLLYNNELYIDFTYYDMLLKENYIVLEIPTGYDILRLGNTNDPLNKDDLLESYNIDSKIQKINVDDVVKEYSLNEVKDIINRNKKEFQKYSYYILNNDGVNGYRREILLLFNVFVKNREFINEDYFYKSLGNLNFSIVESLNPGVGGQYSSETNEISILEVQAGDSYTIYHELMHFYDLNVASEVNSNHYIRVCGDSYYIEKEYKEVKNCENKFIGTNGNFLLEAGATLNTTRYSKKFTDSYDFEKNIYNALVYLLGEEKMNDIYFSSDSNILFAEEILKCLSVLEYEEFINELNNYVYNSDKKINIEHILNSLVKIYETKKGKNWINDKEFMFILGDIGSLYLYDYNASLLSSELYSYLTKVDMIMEVDDILYKLHGMINDPNGLFETFNYKYYRNNGKSYVDVWLYSEDSNKRYLIDYDFEKEKINNYELVEES